MSTTACLDRIGVGIDTARYGHRVSFLRPDHHPAAKALTVMENRAGYQSLHERLKHLHEQHPNAHFWIRIDAAGQYAMNLEHFLRNLDLPMTISIGEPKRNKDYQKAHFPKRTTDDTESQAMARFAVIEQPKATPGSSPSFVLLREIAGRLQAQVRQSTRAVNRLHNTLARTFPELAQLTDDISTGWVLRLLGRYPTAKRIASARYASLEGIPHISAEQAAVLRLAAETSVASLSGASVEVLVRNLVADVRRSKKSEQELRELLVSTFDELPCAAHRHVPTIPGIGRTTAAILVAKIMDIERFATPGQLVSYFGVFPEEHSSGVDKTGKPLPPGTMSMSPRGNDLVRGHLWNAALCAIRCNPAARALYRRLRAKGRRGDVAVGHCMRKLLHLVFAVWKTDRPFDPNHFPWESPDDSSSSKATAKQPASVPSSANKEAVGHKQDSPAKKVVTTATLTVAPAADAVKQMKAPSPVTRPRIDFAFIRQQVSMEEVLKHLGLFERLRGRGHQRRGACPLHSQPGDQKPSFSVHLGKKAFQCFQADCRAQGNVLDLWAAMHRLPLYEAALHLAGTFQLAVNRENEPVSRTRPVAKLAETRA
jgi:transposase